MSRTLGLDDIPLDVFRGVVAFGMGRFTVGRLDGGMKVCGPEFEAWTAHEERQTTARDLRALVGALGFHQLRCVSRQWRATADVREWKAAEKELQAQLPPCEQYDIMHAQKYLRDDPFGLNPIYKDRKTDPWWSEPQCECERCKFEADRGRDKEFIRLDYYCSSYDIDILLLRLGRACDAVLAQLPLNKHGRNPSNYGDSKVY